MSDSQVPTRPLGKDGPQVPRLGLGLMSLSGFYNLPLPDEEQLAFLDEAWKAGARFWDTCKANPPPLKLLSHQSHTSTIQDDT